MGYDLQAVIGSATVLESQRDLYPYIEVVPLHEQLALIPLSSQLLTDLNSKFEQSEGGAEPILQLPDAVAAEKLSNAVVHWLKDLSTSDPVMYCEAEFFGGTGGQFAIVFHNQNVVFGPLFTMWGYDGNPSNVTSGSEMSINRVLRHLGVKAVPPHDEFDTVGLGRHRHTQQWCSTR
jgi:hypothetical protein